MANDRSPKPALGVRVPLPPFYITGKKRKKKNMFQKAIQFVKEAVEELKKVNWLGKKETIASTVVISILIIIVSLFIGLVDFLLAAVIKWVL